MGPHGIAQVAHLRTISHVASVISVGNSKGWELLALLASRKVRWCCTCYNSVRKVRMHWEMQQMANRLQCRPKHPLPENYYAKDVGCKAQASALAIGAALLLAVNIVCVNLASKIVMVVKGIYPRTWYER